MKVPRHLCSLLQFSTTEGYLLSILQLSYLKIRVTKIELVLPASIAACHSGGVLTHFSLCCFIYVIVANFVKTIIQMASENAFTTETTTIAGIIGAAFKKKRQNRKTECYIQYRSPCEMRGNIHLNSIDINSVN